MKLPEPKELVYLLGRTVKSWMRDNAGSMGAALAFYTLFTMAPLLILVIMLAGFFIGRDEAQALLMTQLSGLLGEAGAAGVKSVLNAAHDDSKGLVASIVGFVTLVLGATTVFAELRNDLNRIWQAKPARSPGVWSYLRSRLLSFGMVATIGFLLLTSLVVSAALAYVGKVIGGGAILLYLLDFVASLAALTVLFAAIFKILPSQRIEWRDVWVGSAMTALLFWVGKFLIGLYLGKSAITSEFGAAGTLVVAIAWVYYSSQVFFLGAEFTREYSLAYGTHRTDEAASALNAPGSLLERARRVVTSRA
jgi:membrane protein